MNKAKIRGAVCPSCGRDNSEYGNICTADDCPGVKPKPPSREDSLSAKLRRRGIPHSAAQYDALGNCLTCGVAIGRCPGVHTFEDIQAAGRAR